MSIDEVKIIYACGEHVELAIDDYINYNEGAPEINCISGRMCDYCKNSAEYEVK